jgi:hypothetical protein
MRLCPALPPHTGRGRALPARRRLPPPRAHQAYRRDAIILDARTVDFHIHPRSSFGPGAFKVLLIKKFPAPRQNHHRGRGGPGWGCCWAAARVAMKRKAVRNRTPRFIPSLLRADYEKLRQFSCTRGRYAQRTPAGALQGHFLCHLPTDAAVPAASVLAAVTPCTPYAPRSQSPGVCPLARSL